MEHPAGNAAGRPRRALLVVDMQNGFCHPEGSLPALGLALAGAEAAVERASAAVATARAAGLPVIFTRHVYRPGRADEGRNLGGSHPALAEVSSLAAGSWDADVVDELGCGPGDLIVDKVRFDAFLWTSLDPLLQGLGAEELVVCGVVTNICVESTVRAAYMRDYRVTLLGDACAALSPRLHEIGLEVMGACGFATVTTVAEVFGAGHPASGGEAAAAAGAPAGEAPDAPSGAPLGAEPAESA
ncbi:cysteine hydrolase [Streptomyces hoynatensis]|uniref:Cysteine hydrolase n=2 Tax=Streptomyces hoynatensis TaxID=1141874 RepID=A0A3A9YSN9_9ACTN|nr:cysteine hydrolase [Streptomyces hoynatensis]